MKSNQKPATADRTEQRLASNQVNNCINLKPLTMGKEKMMTDEVAISLSNEKATTVVSTKVESEKVQKILKYVKEKNDAPGVFLGFEEHIIGYSLKENALLFDGHGVLYQMAREYMIEDGVDDEEEMDDYFDQANDMLFSSGLSYTALVAVGKKHSIKSIVPPIIVFYPLTDYNEGKKRGKVKSKISEFKEVIDEIINSDEDPRILKGFENQFFGYDIDTRAFVYSGEGIIKQLAEEKLREDKEKSNPLLESAEYHAHAYQFVQNGGLLSSFLYEGKNSECDYKINEAFEPIIIFESII